MNVQYEKSLHTLELPAVLEMLAAQAVSETAKQNCLNLRPVSEKGMVRRRLAETSAAKQMMVLKGSPSFYGIKDVRHSLSRADLGGMLNTTELLAIAKVLTCTRNIRTAGVEEVCKVNYMRLTGSVVDNGKTLCGGGCKHNIAGGTNRCYVKIYRSANKAFVGIAADGGVAVYGCTQSFKALYVLVDGTCTQITTAGQCSGRPAEASQLSTQNVIRTTHHTCQIQGNTVTANGASVDTVSEAFNLLYLCTHTSNNFQCRINIAHFGQIF